MWPRENFDHMHPAAVDSSYRARIEVLRDRIHEWFNRVYVDVMPVTTYDRRELNKLLRRTAAAVAGRRYHEDYRGLAPVGRDEGELQTDVDLFTTVQDAQQEAVEAMTVALRIVRTARPAPKAREQRTTVGYLPNTAFILMWMDPKRPGLVEVHQTIKEVFLEFGIEAVRADEIQHEDQITVVILDRIAKSEFLFADLTGERQNVYYEVGFAHALGKRPILFRRKGTPLHFDLSVHNAPEYENLMQLRTALRERLAAITGRTPDPTAA